MINFHKPSLDALEAFAVNQVLRSGHLTAGEQTRLFEEEFAKYVGAKYAVFVNSCTSALGLSIEWYKKKLHLKEGQHNGVAVPSFTYVATVSEILRAGLTPEFIDIDLDDCCIEQNELWRKIKSGTVCLSIPVNYGGQPVPGGIYDATIFDSAHYCERGCYKYGTMCFSFYPTKNMTTGEGGMIVTDDEEEYKWYMKARHHGKTKSVGSGYDVEFVGSKFNNTDISAAIGREQLAKLDSFNKRRNEIVKKYNDAFEKTWRGNHLYPVYVSDRDAFVQALLAKGIETSVHFKPVHTMSFYKEKNGASFDKKLPNTMLAGKHIVSLPLYPSLTDEEVEFIIKTVLSTNQLL